MNDNEHNDMEILPIGARFGCYTIIAGFEAYQEERAKERIEYFLEEKQKFLRGEKSSRCHIDSVEAFDRYIQEERDKKLYKVQCKCGRTHFSSGEGLKLKKWRDCGENCGIRKQKEAERIASYPRVKSRNYDVEFVDNVFESLRIIACVDDHVESNPYIPNRRKKKDGVVYISKLFRCKCYLCGKIHEFNSEDFKIINHGYNGGYYSDVFCDCHVISSFQWRTVLILQENNVPYRVEVSFEDLLGEKGNPLRYDFAILNPDGSTKCLVECQGKQHYEIGGGFGGYDRLAARQKRDEQKREYARNHHVLLVEIPYTINTYDKQVEFMKKHGII